MRSFWNVFIGALAIVLVALGLVWTISYQQPVASTPSRNAGDLLTLGSAETLPFTMTVSGPYTPTVSVAVRDLPEDEDLPTLVNKPATRDDHGYLGPDIQMPPHGNVLVDLQQSAPEPIADGFETPILNFAGVQDNSSPPDDTGDVGMNHYLQGDNGPSGSRVTIYDKTGVQLDQFDMEDLASSAPCNSGYCDPIIQYDDLADRWMIAEFDSSANTLCVYISTTPDPTGSWYAYAFDPPGGMQDYPKYGVWSDGYYIGVNNGGTVIVLERNDMLNGQPATMQTFNIGELPGFGFQLTVPATLEGQAPPAGAPAYFLRPRDTEIHGGTCPGCDLMEMWEFHVDWVTPANSSLTALPGVQLTDWDQTLCGSGSDWSCMPQPGTSQALDPIREPVHYPLQYRNFGTHETLVGCFAEDVDGTDHAAVHWFEIRRTPAGSGTWIKYQEGVIGDGTVDIHRSVCSAAMDSAGNIAVGYTRTGSQAPNYPSIYYSGRLASDPLGTMPYYDNLIWNATTSKTDNERWGDYSGIGVDPFDGCTFWYTTEYGGSGQTRIAAFKFDECGTPDFTLNASPDVLDVCAPDDAVFDVTLGVVSNFSNTVTLSVEGAPAGTTLAIAPNPLMPPGLSTVTIGSTNLADPGSYDITISGVADDSPGHEETVELNLFDTGPSAPVLLLPVNGSLDQSHLAVFDWNDTPGATSYRIEVATDPDFTSLIADVSGLAASTWTPTTSLPDDTVLYWRVTAENACGEVLSQVSAFRTLASSCLTYVSTDVPKAINDNSTVNSVLVVPDFYAVTDVDVIINSITHTYDGDLDISILHPDGTQIELSTDNGGTGENYINTRFDDAASTPITSGSAPFTGSFIPEGNISSLEGKPANGTWTLRVADDAGSDTGTLNAWSVVICGAPAGTDADYSDLNNSFGVAWHEGDGDLRLGTLWTLDTAFAPVGFDDASDDGVAFVGDIIPGEDNTVRVTVQGTPVSGRWLRLWFDWNSDGIFGNLADGELVYDGALVDGSNDLTVAVPGSAVSPLIVRARLYDSASAPERDAESWGGAVGGEVEDHAIVLGSCASGLELTPATAAMSGEPGSTVTYNLTVTNTGTCGDVFSVDLGGNTWVVDGPLTVGPVAPGAGAAVQFTVDIPAGANPGDSDDVTVTLTSQGNPAVSDSSILTTTATGPHAVGLTVDSSAKSGIAGQVVTYFLTVTNLGSTTDTFTLSDSGGAWGLVFSETELTLDAGESAEVTVDITIPAGALPGDTDDVTITAVMTGDPGVTDQVVLTTTVINVIKLYIPLIFR